MHRRAVHHLSACLLLAAMSPTAALAQDLTPEEQAAFEQMMKISAAQLQMVQEMGTVVRYNVVGVYRGAPNVASDPNWMAAADVTDRVEFTFDWDMTQGQLQGQPRFQNHKATLANPRNPEPKCAPPKVNGPYDYAELTALKQGIGASIDLHWQTLHPAVQVPQFCTGALKSIPPATRQHVYNLPVMAPTVLQMKSTADVKIAADKKSFSLVKHDWVWTLTPVKK